MPVPLDQLLLFLVGSVLVTIVPGPDMALVMRQVFIGGTALAQRTIYGNLSGLVVHAAALAAGLSALLVASAEAYTVVRLAGAVYLVYLRPISLIRYMGGLGQSSNPGGRSYDRNGLPLVPGLIEVITQASAASGQRHHALAKYIGRIAIKTWAGTPNDPSTETAGTKWMLATAWVPYQLPTFVTPSFPAYVSGHSTFSRAAAEVLAAFTGSAYFPGGLASYVTEADGLTFEHGPTKAVALEWATYFDAADQAGQSRLFGGIHIQADDFMGRKLGSACGLAAWRLAQEYFTGELVLGEAACRPAA